ncbi:SPOR domain-containing protein [Nitrosospira sp. Is2]|uniref:SPOR domain-containing protein n=1 Tax=Nitrosospira sp. Is2 TaxID=3080532 RepID=UPI002953655B|nr:SPOR domain-containing protein [Nitrosospira sp. Is2]WON75105.1 SPOR domain-containing protein [Nitrosospira sp. Is2]
MRILFFLLLFANLIFAAYIQWGPAASGRVQLAAEFHPERIQPLSALPAGSTLSASARPEPERPVAPPPALTRPKSERPESVAPGPVAPEPRAASAPPESTASESMASASAAPEPARPATCLEWGDFLSVEHARMEAAMARVQLNHETQRIGVGKRSGYWVYIPPLRNREHAVRKMGELGRLRINNYYHVQDNGQWNNAISMGFFVNEDEADDLLEELKRTGVRSAVMGKRYLEQIKFVLRDPPQEVVEKMKTIKGEFPGSKLETVQCDRTRK